MPVTVSEGSTTACVAYDMSLDAYRASFLVTENFLIRTCSREEQADRKKDNFHKFILGLTKNIFLVSIELYKDAAC
jgi:hypothetical protein